MERNRWFHPRRQRPLRKQVGILSILAISCQSTTSFVGDQYYDKGRYSEAEAAYAGYLESSSTDRAVSSRALFRLGVIYATLESPMHDPQRSVEMLEQLVARYPECSYAAEATVLLDLLLETGDLALEVQQLQSQLTQLEEDLAARETNLFVLQKQLGVKEGELTEVRKGIPPLEAQIQELVRQLEEKESELEQLDRLKAIDLESPPPRERR